MNRQYDAGEDAPDGRLVGASATELPPRRELREQPRPSGEPQGRTTPRQFLHEVNVEMRKVAWPTRASTINYSTVVLLTLAILMAIIFGLDVGFSKLAIYLFK